MAHVEWQGCSRCIREGRRLGGGAAKFVDQEIGTLTFFIFSKKSKSLKTTSDERARSGRGARSTSFLATPLVATSLLCTYEDGLWSDNISPSLYAKAQGKPVKIWGFLAHGRLEYWVLPQDYQADKYKSTNMNGYRYNHLVTTKFAQWRRDCFGDDRNCHVVQDHERCLWQSRNLEALSAAGCRVVEKLPKSSPDLNAIEGVWHLLKQRMVQTEPDSMETRPEFLVRLRRQVTWLNDNRRAQLLELCTNQKVRAKEVAELLGAKCKW